MAKKPLLGKYKTYFFFLLNMLLKFPETEISMKLNVYEIPVCHVSDDFNFRILNQNLI